MGSILLSLMPTIISLIGKVIPDAQAQKTAAAELMKMVVEGELRGVEAQANVIMSELNSQNWLASCWRPIMMLTFLVLIVSAWFGFIPPNMNPAMIDHVFTLLEIGMGGYVVSRSVEKIVSTIAPVFGRKL